MRTIQHIIDSNAIKKVMNAFPEHWVVRELSERDYGIDLVVEIFTESGKDKNNYPTYESRGDLLNIQVKGKNDQVKPTKNGTVNYSLGRNNLKYCEKFAIPFILLIVDTSNDSGEIYFTWIQKYIKNKLNIECADWRNEPRFNKDGTEVIKNPSYSIEIPALNTLSTKIHKLEKIASQVKYIEELAEYIEIFSIIHRLSDDISIGHFHPNQETYNYLVTEAKKITLLHKLIELNNCNIDTKKVRDLLFHFTDIKANGDISEIAHYPHKEEFERLLYTEMTSRLSTESLEEIMCAEPAY